MCFSIRSVTALSRPIRTARESPLSASLNDTCTGMKSFACSWVTSTYLELLLPSWIYIYLFFCIIVESVKPVSPADMPIYCLCVNWADFWNKNEMLFWISKRVVVALYKGCVIPLLVKLWAGCFQIHQKNHYLSYHCQKSNAAMLFYT